MKIHQQNKKVQLVTTIHKLERIARGLMNSPNMADNMLALEIAEAVEDLNRRGEKSNEKN